MNAARRAALVAFTAAASAWPLAAAAHSPVPGLDHFYGGLLHPWLVPAHAIALLALGLAVGRRSGDADVAPALRARQRTLFAFVAALATGLVATGVTGERDTDPLLLALGLAAAAAVVAGRVLPAWAQGLLAAAVGAVIGLGSGAGELAGRPLVLALAGAGAGATLALLAATVLADLPRAAWQRIALRVGASWLAASALLVLALELAR